MSDLGRLFHAEETHKRWIAERSNASARCDLAAIDERIARLISQHDPIGKMNIDREELRLVLAYVQHGDMHRLHREYGELIVRINP